MASNRMMDQRFASRLAPLFQDVEETDAILGCIGGKIDADDLRRQIESEAKKAGIGELWLTTAERARWAVNFYRKLGYRVTKVIERPWGRDVVMKKSLE